MPIQSVIIIPCYNEERRLRTDAFLTFLSKTDNVRFLFVDDGSTDGTRKMLHQLCLIRPDRMNMLSLAENQGKGEAVRQGFLLALESDAEAIGYWDADLATPLSSIPAFSEMLGSRPDIHIVFGARVRLSGRLVHRKSSRHYLGRIFATVTYALLRMEIYDTQCGAKLFRRSALPPSIFARPFLTRWLFDTEILLRFQEYVPTDRLQKTLYELPLDTWTDTPASKLRMRDFLRIPMDFLRVYSARRHAPSSTIPPAVV